MRTNCWWRLSGYVMRHRRDLLLGFGAALAGTVIAVLVPLVTKRVIDDAIAADHRPLAPWAVVLVAAAGATYLLTYVRRYYGGRIAHLVQHDLRMDAFQALLRWDGRQQDRWSSGQLIVRTTNDLQLVQALLFDVPNVLRHVLTLLLGVAVMTWLSVPLALLAVLLVPVIGLIAHRSRRLLAAATHCAQEHKAAVTGVVDAAVCGIRVVKAFGQEERETVKLVTASRALYAAQLRVARLNAHFGSAAANPARVGSDGGLRARRMDGRAGQHYGGHLCCLLGLPDIAGAAGMRSGGDADHCPAGARRRGAGTRTHRQPADAG